MKKKKYILPKVTRVALDYTISLRMASQPIDPPPRGANPNNNPSQPFASPFGDKPFS